MSQGFSGRAGAGVSSVPWGAKVFEVALAQLGQLGRQASWPATASGFAAARTRAPVWLLRLLAGLWCVLVFGGSGLAQAAPPTVTSISPASGSTAGGTPVIINGTDFTGATGVTFGGASATGVTIISATEITATAPSGTGTVDVQVTTTGGTSATSAADQFTYVAAPSAGAVSIVLAYGSPANPIPLALGGGTATSVAVVSGATHGVATASGTSITYTAKAGYVGADSFTYAATNGAGTSLPAAITVTVIAPIIDVAPSVLPAMTVGAAYSQTITASGGTAPYTYSSAGTLPAGLTLAANGLLSGTPTTAGSYSFTVTATDSSTGTGAPFTRSRSYSGTVAAAAGPPVANAFSAFVAYGSTNNPITLSLGGGTATSVAVVSGATHGVATASGTGITYTPSAGYIGADSFTYSATNGAGTSASAIVSISVSMPVLTITPSGPWSVNVGQAYSQTLTWSGGAQPYAGYSVTGLPAGLSLTGTTANSLTISGTPTVAGSSSVRVQATDSSTGIGPVTLSATFTLTVVGPTLALAPASTALTATSGGAFTQTFSASGGVAPYVYTLTGALPSGLSWNVATATLSGTPTQNGDFPMTVTVTDSSTGLGAPFSASLNYMLTIGSAQPVAVNDSASTPVNQAVSIPVTGNDSGIISSVTISTPPAHGSAVVNGKNVIYTPANNYVGSDTLRYTATGPGGTSAPATVTITVTALSVPVAGAHSATAKAGTAVAIDVMAGATGGPFTAASVVAVTPTAAGAALIRDVGTPGSPSFQMSFTPASAFAGAAVVSYTLRNAQATSAPGQVSITVAPRPDMATNAEVTGLLAAQTDSVKRFASAQMSNFSRRLESLHGDGWGRSDFGISLAASTGRTASDEAQRQSGEADRYVGATLQPNLRKVGWSQRRGDYAVAQDQSGDTAMAAADNAAGGSRLPNLPEPREQANKQAFSLWVGGALDYGRQDAKGPQADYKFTTNGLSAGVDYRIHERATIGIGAGVSRGSSTIGSDGSKSSAGSTVAVVYGSLRPAQDVFIDGMLGYGKLDFDTTRYITDGGGFATGARQGEQVFGSLASGVEYRGASWLWSPYGRLEMSSTTLDAYTETAPSLKALTYFKQTVRTTNGILGLRAEGRYATAWGLLMPRVRLEYTHRFEGADEARLAYADLGPGGPVYIVRSNGQDFGNWTTGLGAKLVLRNGVALSLDFNTNINMSSGRSQSLMVGVAAPF